MDFSQAKDSYESSSDSNDRNSSAAALHHAAYEQTIPSATNSNNGVTAAVEHNSKSSEKWTYLVNLTANISLGIGSDHKFEQLRKLKDLTRDNDSEVIVQEYDNKGDGVKRYTIAHGTITDAQDEKSEGPAKNLEHLIASAPQSGHLVLINEAHGNGDVGFLGDEGSLTVKDFAQSVKSGLSATGRDHLDVLSMDSCLMANIHALSNVSGLADRIVASELEEVGNINMSDTPPRATFDMQPIGEYLAELLKHQPKNSLEAANDIFKVSSKSCDAIGTPQLGCGTPTLAVFDPAKIEAARAAFDDLGSALNAGVADPANKAAIQAIIADSHDISQAGDALRDADSLAGKIVSAIQGGKYKDGDGAVERAAENVIKADSAMTESFYVNPNTTVIQVFQLQNKLHGTNVFLPGADFDVKGKAEDFYGPVKADSTSEEKLLQMEIDTSMADDANGGWAKFVRSMSH